MWQWEREASGRWILTYAKRNAIIEDGCSSNFFHVVNTQQALEKCSSMCSSWSESSLDCDLVFAKVSKCSSRKFLKLWYSRASSTSVNCPMGWFFFYRAIGDWFAFKARGLNNSTLNIDGSINYQFLWKTTSISLFTVSLFRIIRCWLGRVRAGILVIVRRLKSGFLHERVTHQNHPLAIQFLVGTRLLILVIWQ